MILIIKNIIALAIIGVATNVGVCVTSPSQSLTLNSDAQKSNIMEIWKDVKGYEGLYQVSNFGRVKSFHKKRNAAKNNEGILRDYMYGKYKNIQFKKEGKRKHFLVHRLVAMAFIPNPHNKETVNHIDGNKLNNSVTNLEWCTHSENAQHAYDNGLVKYRAYRKETGIHVRCRPIVQMNLDGSQVAQYGSQKEAHEKTGIQQTNIGAVCRGERDVAGGFKWKYKDKMV